MTKNIEERMMKDAVYFLSEDSIKKIKEQTVVDSMDFIRICTITAKSVLRKGAK